MHSRYFWRKYTVYTGNRSLRIVSRALQKLPIEIAYGGLYKLHQELHKLNRLSAYRTGAYEAVAHRGLQKKPVEGFINCIKHCIKCIQSYCLQNCCLRSCCPQRATQFAYRGLHKLHKALRKLHKKLLSIELWPGELLPTEGYTNCRQSLGYINCLQSWLLERLENSPKCAL